MIFGDRLKELRKQHNMTQAQLADTLKIARRSVTNYEAGKGYPNKEVLTWLEEVFNVRVHILMDEQDEFIAEAQRRDGYRGRLGAEELVKEASGLFAGGNLSEADKDAVMRALQDAYWDAKEKNKKYTPNKYKKQNDL